MVLLTDLWRLGRHSPCFGTILHIESAHLCQRTTLDDGSLRRLHPDSILCRPRHRIWNARLCEFGVGYHYGGTAIGLEIPTGRIMWVPYPVGGYANRKPVPHGYGLYLWYAVRRTPPKFRRYTRARMRAHRPTLKRTKILLTTTQLHLVERCDGRFRGRGRRAAGDQAATRTKLGATDARGGEADGDPRQVFQCGAGRAGPCACADPQCGRGCGAAGWASVGGIRGAAEARPA